MTDVNNDNISTVGLTDSRNEALREAANTGRCESELFYIANGRSLKALAILCEGLRDDDGDPLVDLSILPWSSARKSSDVKPTANELRAEILRRFNIESGENSPTPRPNKWTTSRAREWLSQHPITGEDDIIFIKRIIAERTNSAELAARESAQEESALSSNGSNWVGKYPMLRLIHALIDHDEIKRAFHTRHNLPGGRMEVENRNTEELRMSSVWQLMADKWNDPLFLPVTAALPDVHSEFGRPIPLSYETVSHMQPATAEKVEERWQSMNLALNRIISDWERSGQGDGGFVSHDDLAGEDEYDEGNEDEIIEHEFGSLRNRPQRALDQRKSFTNGKNCYLLYLWEMLEKHDLLGSSIQRLNSSVCASNGNSDVPLIIGGKHSADEELSVGFNSKGSSKKGKKNDIVDLTSSIDKHGESLLKVAHIAAVQQEKDRSLARESSITSRIDTLRDLRRNLNIRLASHEVSTNSALRDVIMREVEAIDDEINENLNKLKTLHDTPQKSNRSPY
jgi:hypothetical protein